MESSPRDQKYGQRRQGLCVVWDKVKLVLAVFCVALCCRLRSDSRVQSSEPTQTLTRGDSGSLTGTSSFRGVCSTLPGALGKATCCLTAKPFFAIPCFKEIRLCAVATADQQPLGRFGPHLGLQNRRDSCPWKHRVTNSSRETVSGRSTVNACSLP